MGVLPRAPARVALADHFIERYAEVCRPSKLRVRLRGVVWFIGIGRKEFMDMSAGGIQVRSWTRRRPGVGSTPLVEAAFRRKPLVT